eukprot:TRINITY_DN578_c0_g1_i1.p1 TRINITY_DN578_c0_g1~~TRINITY_DN578_c0_g1_i1.p1  ORF type:complete len:2128 (+),score=1061.57 TRINITY_DN578_c0_g1_i1:428-6385(+)
MPKIVQTFTTWWSDPRWEQFLRVQIPSFILLNDAEQVQHIMFPPGFADEQAIADVQFLLRAFMVDCIVKRLHAVYTTRLVRKDNFIHAFVIRSSSKRFLPNGKEIRVHDLYAECEKLFGDNGSHPFVAIEKEKFPTAGRFGKEGDSTFDAPAGTEEDPLRVRLAASALSKVLKDASEFKSEHGADLKVDLAKAFLLHVLVLKRLPINYRSHSLTEDHQEDDERSPYFAACDDFFKQAIGEAAKLSNCTAADLFTAEGKAREVALAKEGEFSDAWDFRMNRKVIALLLANQGSLQGPDSLVADFQRIWKAVSGLDLDPAAVLGCKEGVPPLPSTVTPSNFALLPTEETLVSELLGDLEVPELTAQAAKNVNRTIERRGWLQQSQLWQAQDFEEMVKSDDLFKSVQAAYAGAYDTSNVSNFKKKKMEMRMDRARVKFLHSIQSGAESMSGGFLPQADQKVIARDSDKEKGAKKVKLGSKAAEIAEKNRIALEHKEKESQERAWSNFYSKLEVKKDMPIEKLGYCAEEIQKLVGMRKIRDPAVLLRAKIERLKLLERQWLLISKDAELKEKRMNVAVSLFRGVHELVKQYLEHIRKWKGKDSKYEEAAAEKEKKDKKDKKGKKKEEEAHEVRTEYEPLFGDDEMQILRRVLVMLGLKENCKRVDQKIAKAEGIEYQKDGKHKMPNSSATSKSARVINKDSANVNDRSHVRFQMSKMGHLFDRSTGEEDSRVIFKPDPWQKEMLDAVDRRESILCCAPTSAGKTFISYYCMKEVIFSSKEDVVVYVAPTRALCNQAAQDVYSIFSNKKYTESGWSLFGILGGGNYVQPLPPMGGPFQTQILITIPSVFEHVMLAPRYQQWAKRVKYVIFDEVHCVDTSAEGHLWERLLMCTRSPYLALSATVGNFEAFKTWLDSTQQLVEKQDKARGTDENRSYRVNGVYWNQRWNDLRKFIYLPRSLEDRSKGRVKIAEAGSRTFGDDNIRPLHPFSTVTRAMLEKLGQFPQDLPLVPQESLDLFDAMQASFEAASRMLIGTWSDDDGNRFKFEDGKFVGRRGAFKGITGTKDAEVPAVPEHEFEDFKAEESYSFEGGKVWCHVNDDDELEVVMSKGGEVSCFTTDHEIDECIIESVQEDGTLCPEVFFDKDVQITQLRSREYEAALKDGFMSWVRKSESDVVARVMADHVIAKLGGGLRSISEQAENVASQQATPLDTSEFIEANFTDLLLCLNSEGLLPALVFNFDQRVCEDLARKIVTQLEEAEETYKQSNEWKNVVKRLTDQMNQQKKQVKAFQAAKDTKGKKEDGEGDAKEQLDEPELVDCSIPDILPSYAFCHGDRGDGLKKEDLERLLKDLENDLERSHFLIRALERGIGVHHAGLPTKYRNNVEKLFRLKKLKVVVATDGLALGIHSPCRSVVLAGDDVRLSTMQFRQMSGRAGRRGQDFIGHVVFYGIPEAKIVRLMTSGLPTLQGHMSIDTTTVLRSSLLHSFQSQAKGRDRIEIDQQRVRHMAQCMMESMFTLGKTKAQGELADEAVGTTLYKNMLRLQWRYTTDYLQREGLITPTGTGMFLPGLVTRALYSIGEVHMNPPNLVFTALLKRGVFQKEKVCGPYTRKENALIVAHLSKFLATLFSLNGMGWKQEIHRSVRQNPDVLSEDCPHDVILDPLNELFSGEVWKTMRSYTDETLEIFSELAKGMAEEVEKLHGKDTKLPLSRVDFKGEEELSGLLKELADQASVVKARSPFVAVCGLQDKFHCVDDLCQSLRSCLHLEEDSIPIIDFIDIQRRDEADRWVTINAVCSDYVMEGAQMIDGVSTRLYLQELNGLSQSLSWMVLNRYFATVTNITDLVERLAPAWPQKDRMFTCCNTLCPPETQRFNAERGLYKCHECDLVGRDTFMCPKCYEEGEECVTQQDDKFIKNKSHVFFRFVFDKFVQTMSHIAADLDPLNTELGRSQRTNTTRRKKKQYEDTNKKPKRPILQRPQRRGAQLFVTSHKRK